MNITAEQSAEMQRRLNEGRARRLVSAAVDMFTDVKPKSKEAPAIVIGIDPGTNTGFAEVFLGKLLFVQTVSIYEALRRVENCDREFSGQVLVRFEDARLRQWFGKSGTEKWKGAGSIMRDCAIWEETLTALGIPFEKVPPKEVKETTAEYFRKLTGWTGRTSIHAREAAWLVLPYLKNIGTKDAIS
mgnify:CR=1 FL=1